MREIWEEVKVLAWKAAVIAFCVLTFGYMTALTFGAFALIKLLIDFLLS